MKKFILIIAILIIVVPSVTFAAWWNPKTWFNSWRFSKIENKVLLEKPDFVEPKIEENTKEILKNNNVNKKTSSLVETKNEIDKLKKEIEILKNKEKITAPVLIQNNNDSLIKDNLIQKKENVNIEIKKEIDLCPNLIGIQSVIPEGRFFYKNTKECLTEDELDFLEKRELKEETKQFFLEEKKRKDILSNLAKSYGLEKYESNLPTEDLELLLKNEQEKERNKILQELNKLNIYKSYNSSLSNASLKTLLEEAKSCLNKNSSNSPYDFVFSLQDNSCESIKKNNFIPPVQIPVVCPSAPRSLCVNA